MSSFSPWFLPHNSGDTILKLLKQNSARGHATLPVISGSICHLAALLLFFRNTEERPRFSQEFLQDAIAIMADLTELEPEERLGRVVDILENGDGWLATMSQEAARGGGT